MQRAKKITHCFVKFETREENRIVPKFVMLRSDFSQARRIGNIGTRGCETM